MHGGPDIFRCDENIRAARCFWCEKSVADLMNRQFAGYEIGLRRKNISVLADARDLARALELAQCFAQCNSSGAAESDFASDLSLVRRPVILRASSARTCSRILRPFLAISTKQYCQAYRLSDFNRRSNYAKSDYCWRIGRCGGGDRFVCCRRS